MHRKRRKTIEFKKKEAEGDRSVIRRPRSVEQKPISKKWDCLSALQKWEE